MTWQRRRISVGSFGGERPSDTSSQDRLSEPQLRAVNEGKGICKPRTARSPRFLLLRAPRFPCAGSEALRASAERERLCGVLRAVLVTVP